ncbi:MAG: putative RDD family membrane protein YckC [Arenicella sp.]
MKIRISTTQNVSIEYELASLGERMIAYVVDALIWIAYSLIVIGILSQFNMDDGVVILALAGIPVLLYEVICGILFDGQTSGKMTQKIKVISKTGRQPNAGQFVIRWLFRPIDFWIGNGGIAVITIAASGKEQRVDDLVANTCVVSIAEKQKFSNTLFPEIDEEYVLTFPQVTALSDSDIRLIKEVIINYRKNRDSKPLQLISNKTKELLNIESDLLHLQFLREVIKDHQHLTSI